MFLAAMLVNGLILKTRIKEQSIKNPELKTGYNQFFRAVMFYGSIPWIIMMIGALGGMTVSTFDYFKPREMNPIVLIFHAYIILIWILTVRWLYFKKGAEFLEKHAGVPTNKKMTAAEIKRTFPLALIGGIAAMVFMWFQDFPIPNF